MWLAGIQDEEYYYKKTQYWDNVYGYKMKSLTKWMEQEPLIDTIEDSHIITNSCPIVEFDLKTVTIDELNFTAHFSLKAKNNDLVTGFVGWFDCYFTDCHIIECLDTSPFKPYTHWKQTIFYMNDTFQINQNDIISGNIAVRKNKKNPRELEIKLWATNPNPVKRDPKEVYKYFLMH